jgi:carboxyl-terminal processing protease
MLVNRLMTAVLAAATIIVLAPLAGAQEPAPSPRGGAPYAPCTPIGQNMQTSDVLNDLYLWYRYIPDVKPWRYASPEAYLEAVRYRPLDSHFSYITSKAEYTALFSESQYVGFGFSTRTTESSITVLQVFPDSPASEAQLGRGDRIIAVDGRSVASLVDSGAIGSVFGANEAGVTVVAEVVSRGGQTRTVPLRKRAVTIPPVSLTRAFEVNGRVVGYILFRQFVRPSTAALDEAFAALRQAGATELILDLRYNGGGLVDVAVHLGSLIGDAATRGQVFARIQHNDKNSRYDETLRFEAVDPPLRLTRLFVITTRASASASEMVINSLEPYLPVVVIGERTFGKPVGQYGIEMCDKVLLPVAFITVNANGEGNYFDGIAPDCEAPDDVGNDLGAPAEASLAAALQFIRTGACSRTSPDTLRMRRASVAYAADGWQSLINAQ